MGAGDRPVYRVMCVSTGLRSGGAEHALLALVQEVADWRFAVEVVTLEEGGELRPLFESAGIRVASLGMTRPVPDPRAAARLRAHIRRVRADLLVGWMYHGNLATWLGCRFIGATAPMVWNVRHAPHHLREESRSTRWTIRAGARCGRGAFAIAYNSRASAARHHQLGYPTEKSRVIYNGVDSSRFRPSPPHRSSLRQRLGLAHDSLIVARVGRAHPMKGFPAFVRACAPLLRRHPSMHLLVAGPGCDAGFLELEQCIDRLGVRDRISILGGIEAMPELLAGVDILCSSSRCESFPNVVAEAMACAVPCVVTDVGASRELVGSTDLIVPPSDDQAMTDALDRLVAMTPAQRAELGRSARDRVCRLYSLRESHAQHARLWLEAIASHGRVGRSLGDTERLRPSGVG